VLSGQIAQEEAIKEAGRLANIGRPAPNKGIPMSAEQRQKIAQAHRGLRISPETKHKIATSMEGNKNSVGFKNNLGHKWTDEMKEQAKQCALLQHQRERT
jgi:hypothetical protein